jgi:membrane-bound metal-dependent hydrolase YbcI (DUF457 family)
MDLFSHVALGRTVVAVAADKRHGRALVVAGTLGALAPDIDAVLMPFGWDLYLRVHEIGTHSLIGTVACALLTASVVRLFARTHAWSEMIGASWLGAVSHVTLDLLSSARLRVLWPVFDRQISVPLVAMADPWLAAILILGAGLLVFARRNQRRVAGLVIAVSMAFLLLKWVMAARAIDAYRAATSGDNVASSRVTEARWASLSEWHVFDRAAGQLRFWRATGSWRNAQLVMSWPIGPESPLVAASRELPTVRNFLRVHDLAFGTTVVRPDGREWVLWSDVRYCWNPTGEDAPKLEPIIGEGSARLACALWFGGEFDRSGHVLQQLVKIGRFTQRRSAGE